MIKTKMKGVVLVVVCILILRFILKKFVVNPFKEGYNNSHLKNNRNKKVSKEINEKSESKNDFNQNENSVEKGRLFEEFVVKRFKSDHFYKLKEWRGDKFVDGIYAESNMYPDLEIEFQIRDVKRRFAIECKFRSSSLNGVIAFAEYRQLQNYKRFQQQNRIPVYILLGLGGEASKPKELFLIPVNELVSNEIQYKTLKKFKKDITSPFYYNLKDNTLC